MSDEAYYRYCRGRKKIRVYAQLKSREFIKKCPPEKKYVLVAIDLRGFQNIPRYCKQTPAALSFPPF